VDPAAAVKKCIALFFGADSTVPDKVKIGQAVLNRGVASGDIQAIAAHITDK
jgi:hypothetical protein